jgi:hypothetical protein
MTHVSVQIVLVPYQVGNPKEARRVKPVYPSKPKPEGWRPARAIPQLDYEALKRRVEDMRRTTRSQVEALREAGRRFRATMREERRA